MATDNRDDDGEESGERADATIGRYQNGGREADAGRERRRTDPAERRTDRGRAAARPPVGHRYGSRERPRSDRPPRRYGSRPPTNAAPATEPRVESGSAGERSDPGAGEPGDRDQTATGGASTPRQEPEPERRSERPRATNEPDASTTDESDSERVDSERRGGRSGDRPESGEESRRDDAESSRRQTGESGVGDRGDASPPKRTQPLREPADARTADEQSRSAGVDREKETRRYGGPREDDASDRAGGRERELREYERRMDRERDRQREFKRDKSGNRYRRG
ncbi:hypothetical protein [Halorussus marinus]|uniref:hypothetical protein n=1 Tax=Halorussus marinus TaxID=2505976 RepID=UPI0010931C2C|nr:hypothetical protein [Halorussus marinus]